MLSFAPWIAIYRGVLGAKESSQYVRDDREDKKSFGHASPKVPLRPLKAVFLQVLAFIQQP